MENPLWNALGRAVLWVIRHSPRTAAVLFVASAFLLFAPHELLHSFGIEWLSPEHSRISGLIFLISGAFILTYIATWVSSLIHSGLVLHHQKRRLRELTDPEKRVLQRFIANGTKTEYLEAADGIVCSLERNGILFRSAELGTWGYTGPPIFSYNLQDWVWKEIIDNPILIRTMSEPE